MSYKSTKLTHWTKHDHDRIYIDAGFCERAYYPMNGLWFERGDNDSLSLCGLTKKGHDAESASIVAKKFWNWELENLTFEGLLCFINACVTPKGNFSYIKFERYMMLIQFAED